MTPRKTLRAKAFAVPTALLVAAVAACGPTAHSPQQRDASMNAPASKTTSNPVRHDLEPMTRRFPALGSPATASWVSGDMGDPSVPGPSLYWIDAVVELTAETANDLKQRYQPVPTTAAPEVWNTLTEWLPKGGYLASDQLDAAFTTTKLKSKAFLAADIPVVVISAIGE
ncbi:hypothetical protein [Mycobacterium sp. 852013-50091_SCH5140682]|uniref:hypothetical protein n=1 Tax=Mycobacterium sp. 852013-50091_SCH5140682 TaxID=1834109 RepID=UPI0012EAAADA|nr:hypothetical protein [Mycobacterium sp. 852013-50091_SCH5140682]